MCFSWVRYVQMCRKSFLALASNSWSCSGCSANKYNVFGQTICLWRFTQLLALGAPSFWAAHYKTGITESERLHFSKDEIFQNYPLLEPVGLCFVLHNLPGRNVHAVITWSTIGSTLKTLCYIQVLEEITEKEPWWTGSQAKRKGSLLFFMLTRGGLRSQTSSFSLSRNESGLGNTNWSFLSVVVSPQLRNRVLLAAAPSISLTLRGLCPKTFAPEEKCTFGVNKGTSSGRLASFSVSVRPLLRSSSGMIGSPRFSFTSSWSAVDPMLGSVLVEFWQKKAFFSDILHEREVWFNGTQRKRLRFDDDQYDSVRKRFRLKTDVSWTERAIRISNVELQTYSKLWAFQQRELTHSYYCRGFSVFFFVNRFVGRPSECAQRVSLRKVVEGPRWRRSS